jgi:hypothetical protein
VVILIPVARILGKRSEVSAAAGAGSQDPQ